MMVVPLQIEINKYNKINAFKKSNKVMFIYNDDKECFRKCIDIWDKIIELINNHIYFFLRLMKMMNYLLWQICTKIQASLLKIFIDMEIIKM